MSGDVSDTLGLDFLKQFEEEQSREARDPFGTDTGEVASGCSAVSDAFASAAPGAPAADADSSHAAVPRGPLQSHTPQPQAFQPEPVAATGSSQLPGSVREQQGRQDRDAGTTLPAVPIGPLHTSSSQRSEPSLVLGAQPTVSAPNTQPGDPTAAGSQPMHSAAPTAGREQGGACEHGVSQAEVPSGPLQTMANPATPFQSDLLVNGSQPLLLPGANGDRVRQGPTDARTSSAPAKSEQARPAAVTKERPEAHQHQAAMQPAPSQSESHRTRIRSKRPLAAANSESQPALKRATTEVSRGPLQQLATVPRMTREEFAVKFSQRISLGKDAPTKLGEGSEGVVQACMNKQTGELRAVKWAKGEIVREVEFLSTFARTGVD